MCRGGASPTNTSNGSSLQLASRGEHPFTQAKRDGESVKTAQQAQQAYTDAIPRATQNFVAGVQGYQGDWAGKTTAQQGVMLQNLTQAVSSGRWAQGISRVGTGGWKSRTEAKSANYGV